MGSARQGRQWRAVFVLAVAASAMTVRASAQPRPAPTFAKDVAPILFEQCATCHRPDGPAPFALLTYSDARQHAQQIAQVTRTRVMPPWKPESGPDPFIGERRLSDAQIATLAQWAANGEPQGNPEELPPAPSWPSSWQLGTPDLVLTLPDYTLQPSGLDVFRNFVVRVPGSGVRYVRGFEFSPGTNAVHHANIRIDPTPASRALDDEDPDPGYAGIILNSAEYPDGNFLGWTPGQRVPLAPKGLAWTLTAGTDFVVQLHMRPSGKVEHVHPSLALYFTSDPPTEHPAMIRMGRQNLDIPAGASDYHSFDTYTLLVDAEVQAIQPHSHYRARSMRAWASLPDRSVRQLITIPRWDFGWQDAYRYAKPFWLPAGTTVVTEYVFDNSAGNPSNPASPPARARWGFRSSDEMADTWIQVLTRNEADRQRLVGDFRIKADLEDITGYETRISEDPGYAALHNDVAVLYLEVGQGEAALAHFKTVLELQPDSAVAQFNVASTLESLGRFDEAAAGYTRAVALDPNYARAHVNLGTLYLRAGQVQQAGAQYQAALAVDPGNADAHNDLGRVLLAGGDRRTAVEHLNEALKLRPAFPEAHYNLGDALMDSSDAAGAIAQYREALKLRPDWVPCLEALARAYAAAGSFDDAVTAESRALSLVNPADAARVQAMNDRLRLFRAHRAEPAPGK